MNSQPSQPRRFWWRIAFRVAIVLAVALIASFGYAGWEYSAWRNKMIEWDYGTIDRLCGGDTEEHRLLDIRFVKQWEYETLKRTPDGKEVWLHWKLSKRRCGNWVLINRPKGFVIPPFETRFPNGAPQRDAVSCLGLAIDENEKFKHRDKLQEAL